MLQELYWLQTYFGPVDGAVAEETLIAHFGPSAVREALADRRIERRRAPCASRAGFICRLTQAGLDDVLQRENRLCTIVERVDSMAEV